MRDPNELTKVKFEYLLPFHEYGIDVDDKQCQEIAKNVKKFYFGFLDLNVETISVYLMVIEF